MKRVLLSMMFLTVSALHGVHPTTADMPNDIVEVMTIFKNNLTKNENFSEILASMTNEVRQEFIEMVDDVWTFFCRMQTYCIEHIKGNPLFEKYKQFMQKNSIKSTIGFSIETKEIIKKNKLVDDEADYEFQQAMQPFYETLTEEEQIEFKEIIQKLCQFFDELSLEYEQMLAGHASVEEAFSKAFEGSGKTLCIECGLEYPFPTLMYYIE